MSNSPRHPSRLSQYSEDSSFYPRELTESGGILYFINENGVATPLNTSGSTTLKDASGNIIGTIQPRLDGEITIPDATGSDKGLVILSNEAAKASGTSAAGSSTKAARADHVHPRQTTITGNAGSATKLETSRSIGLSGVTATAQEFDGSGDITIPITAVPVSIVTGLSNVATSGAYDDLSGTPTIPVAGTTTPVVAGTAKIGTSEDFARADHVHPAQTSVSGNAGTATKLASKVSIGLSGVTATAQDFDGSDDIIIPITAVPASIVTGLATVATSGKYSDLSGKPTIPAAGTATPKVAGTAAVGSSTAFARADHVHPAQTSVTGNAGSATKLATARTISIEGAVVSDSKSFDGTDDVTLTISSLDASAITGVLPLSAIPKGAQERLIPVANETARQNLTSNDAQNGDVVKVEETGIMYYITDDTKLGTSSWQDAYSVFTAGAASSVAWSGITDKPSFATVATSGSYNDLSNKPTIPVAGTTTPVVASTAKVGTSTAFARADHVHPAQTTISGNAGTATKLASKVSIGLSGVTATTQDFDGSDDITIPITAVPASIVTGLATVATSGSYNDLSNKPTIPAAGTATPIVAGTAAVGSSAAFARADHVHPAQTTISGNAGSATAIQALNTASTNASTYVWFSDNSNNKKPVANDKFKYNPSTDVLTVGSITGEADSAVNDENGNPITSYVKGMSISGKVITYTRGDGTTDTITTQDTTYNTGTASTSGLTKLYTGTGSNTDGSMTQNAITTALDGKAASSHTHVTSAINTPSSGVEYAYNNIVRSYIPSGRANKFYGIQAQYITIEHSRDGGETWYDAGITDEKKEALFTTSAAFRVGGAAATAGTQTTDYMTRVTIEPDGRYVGLDMFEIQHSTEGNTTEVLVEGIWYSAQEDGYRTIVDWTEIRGWAGPNIIYKSLTLGGKNSWSYDTLRFTFRLTAVSSTYNTPQVFWIKAYGTALHNRGPSGRISYNMLQYDTPYSIDSYNQITKFIGRVQADGFIGDITGDITGNAGTATKLAAAKTIGLSGVTATAQSFDGSGNITIPITAVPASIVTGLATVATSGSYNDLSNKPTIPTASSTTPKVAAATAVIGSSANYARADHVHPVQTSVSGNAGTATKLASKVTIDGVEFDGSANITLPAKHPDITLSTDSTSTATASAGTTFTAIDSITKDGDGHVTKVNTKTVTVAANAANGFGYGTCSTAEATTAKVGTLSGYALKTGSSVSIRFTYAVPASATLNINSTGAKSIYDKGAAIKAGVIKAGDTATFVYTGSYYHLVSVSSPSQTYLANIGTSWSGDAAPFTQTITIAGITVNDNPVVDVVPDAVYETATAQIADYGKIYKITTANNSITVYASEATTVTIPIQLKCVK